MSTITYPEALRKLAEFVESQPDLFSHQYRSGTASITLGADSLGIHVYHSAHSLQKGLIRDITRALGGTWNKDANGSTMTLRQSGVLGFFDVNIFATRDAVCERVQVGEQEVTHEAVTARSAYAETVPVYEWECKSIFAPDSLAEVAL